MNFHSLRKVHKRWGSKVQADCAKLDAQLRGQRGPVAKVGTYPLVCTMVYLAFTGQPMLMRNAYKELSGASRRELQMLGLNRKPTYRQLCYALERIQKFALDAPSYEGQVQEILDLLVPASAGDKSANTIWAVDTHLFEGWAATSRSQCADPDATWRVMGTHKHRNNPVLGYQLVAAVRTSGTETCDRIRVVTANVDDAPPAVDAVLEMAAAGMSVERVLADKGFTQKPQGFLDPLRAAGIHVTFDLKSPDLGVSGSFMGNLIVDGWLYSPAMPAKLRTLVRPGPSASAQEWARWHALTAARDAYRFQPHGRPGPASSRIASPATRNRLRCRAVGNAAPAQAPTCRVAHPVGEACGLKTTTFTSQMAARTYQFPVWGTPDWADMYAKRTAVERFFGHLQSHARAGFTRGRYRLMRLAKVALAAAAAVIATNVGLIESAASRAKAAAAKSQAPAPATAKPRAATSSATKTATSGKLRR